MSLFHATTGNFIYIRSTESISMIYYLLAKEVKTLRGELQKGQEWDVCVDLFYYRTVNLNEDLKKDEEEVALDE